MSAEKDFLSKTSDKNKNVILSPFGIENKIKNSDEKIILPLDHKENTAENQTIIQSKRKRRPRKIIVVETPYPENKNIMRKVHIRYTHKPKTVVQKIQSEKPVTHGQKTLSLIRNTPKYRPVILIQPQPYIVTQFALPLVKVPVFKQNNQGVSPNIPAQNNFQKMTPNQIKSLPQSINQSGLNQMQYFNPDNTQVGNKPMNNPGSNFVHQRNGKIINPGPGYNNYNNSNKTHKYNRNDQRIIKNDLEHDNSENGPSPILLFHDHDDENETNKKGNNENNAEALENETEEAKKVRNGTKSKFGRNKLDFISNLFDGYYYTNIDYDQTDTDADNDPTKNIETLENSTTKEDNYSNTDRKYQSSARFSSRLTNSTNLPPINQNMESLNKRQPVSGIKKSDSGQFLPRIDKITKSVNHNSDESLSQVSPSLKDETRIKSSCEIEDNKKSTNSKSKRLNYPRNTVLTNY